MDKALTELAMGEEGIITVLQGGWGAQERLRRMGLQEGQRVRKVSALAWGGPVVVLVNRAQIAIGRGIARRIMVRVPGGAGREASHGRAERG
jgi:ferrous iron transport protein A